MESNMIPIELVVAVVLLITEAIKRGLKRRLQVDELDPMVVPVVALLLGALLSMGNAWLFAPEPTAEVLREAARSGLLAAAAAAGVWSAGTNYVRRLTASQGSADQVTKQAQ